MYSVRGRSPAQRASNSPPPRLRWHEVRGGVLGGDFWHQPFPPLLQILAPLFHLPPPTAHSGEAFWWRVAKSSSPRSWAFFEAPSFMCLRRREGVFGAGFAVSPNKKGELLSIFNTADARVREGRICVRGG